MEKENMKKSTLGDKIVRGGTLFFKKGQKRKFVDKLTKTIKERLKNRGIGMSEEEVEELLKGFAAKVFFMEDQFCRCWVVLFYNFVRDELYEIAVFPERGDLELNKKIAFKMALRKFADRFIEKILLKSLAKNINLG